MSRGLGRVGAGGAFAGSSEFRGIFTPARVLQRFRNPREAVAVPMKRLSGDAAAPWVLSLGIALCAVLAAPGAGRADTSLRIVASDPPSPAVLGRWEHFALRIEYASSEPIIIAAKPSFEARPVPAINGGEAHRAAGQGEVLLWVTYYDAQRIDAVTVTARTATGAVAAQASLPLALAWSGQPVQARPRAEWVERMKAEGERQAKAANEAAMNSPLMQMMGVVVMGMIFTIPGYFLLQGLLVWRLRGAWRKAAAVPLWPMGAIVAYTAYAFADGSNLFPVVLIFTAPLAFAYLAILAALLWLSRISAAGT